MRRAAVPEAPIDEPRHLPSGEDDVWTDAETTHPQEVILAKSQTSIVQGAPHSDLCLRVHATVRATDTAGDLVGGLGVGDDAASSQVYRAPVLLRWVRCQTPSVY